MIDLNGYKIKELIYKGENSSVYKGICDANGLKVIIKLPGNGYPSVEELASIRREFKITNKPFGDKVIKAHCLENYNNSIAIIMEDFGAVSLTEILKTRKLNLTEKLSLAIEITEALKQIHRQDVIHKDINPSNIVYNINTNQLKIIDFGISVELSKVKSGNLHVLEGTCSYISPEQTGKINRSIDNRSDLYGFGITLYEIFTGQLPFNGDSLEIIHSHIARIPVEPKMMDETIPFLVSDIIMKLLSKNAEDRYQTATGLLYDLSYCLANLDSPEGMYTFKLAQKDISLRFEIPQKLYGREKEINILKAFIEKSKDRHTRLLLVSGYSGIGKTSIIREMSHIIFDRSELFISGKFEQLNQASPYSAVTVAFKGLVKKIFADTATLESWKNRFQKTLGANARLITDLIPDLEKIIGKQPETNRLPPVEEKLRFQTVFCDFLNLFLTKENPLILFLDDLQWSDFSTIDLMKYLLTSGKVENLFIIGTYRDNELTKIDQLLLMLEEVKTIKGSSDFLCELCLGPLSKNEMNELVADTFKRTYTDTTVLTNFLYQKTSGNPFFTNQLLTTLYERGVFKFNEDRSWWEWDLREAEDSQISDNVIDFLIQKLSLLPADALEFLKQASCIGNYFDLRTLFLINDHIDNITDALWFTIKNEFILPLDNNYKLLDASIQKDKFWESNIEIRLRFNHDRVQQAAYMLISDKEKVLIHERIGQLLLIEYNKGDADNTIFDLTNHLNLTMPALKSKDERLTLLQFNLIAGMKAKDKIAYDIAKKYFNTGMSLLTAEEWKDYPGKLFDLSLNYAETQFSSGNTEEAMRFCDESYKIATDNIQKASIYTLRAKILEHIGEKREMIINEILNGLLLFGIVFPTSPQELQQKIGEGIGLMQAHLARIPIENLVDLPVMVDKNKIMIMNLLFQALPVTFETNMSLYMTIQLTMFDMAVKYGITDVSCKNFVECGLTQGSLLGDYQAGYNFSKVTFAIMDRYKYDTLRAACYFMFADFVSHWRAHYTESLEYFDLSIKRGLEAGDIQHASYAVAHKANLNLYVGKNLSDCKNELEKTELFLKEHKAFFILLYTELLRYIIDQLQQPYDPEKESLVLNKAMESKVAFGIASFGSGNLIINFILGNLEKAEKWNDFAEPYLPGCTGHFLTADHCMFQSLLLIKIYEEATQLRQEEIGNKLTINLNTLKKWSENSPKNFRHKYYIVAAEYARIQNAPMEKIIELYKEALNSIAPQEFIHIRAVINELIGEFWLSHNEELICKTYIKEAYYYYSQWGAYSKIIMLEKKYSQFFTSLHFNNTLSKKSTSLHTDAIVLDLMSILKSAEAISSEIRLEKLLKVLMNTIIENTGARNGCLILKNIQDGKLYVEAIKSRDSEDIKLMNSTPLHQCSDFCPEIVQYVIRTRENLVIENALNNLDFQNNEYIHTMNLKSVLCIPIIYENDLHGIIYLENNLTENLFSATRIEVLKILSSQIAVSIGKAQLYEKLEDKVDERTKELELVNKELKELSLHDPLTKLHNRRYIYEYVEDLSENFIKEKCAAFFNNQKRDLSINANVFGIFLLDIDHFKKINDTHGHTIGDEVLKAMTNTLKNLIRNEDFFVRWGGEEFLIILNRTKLDYLEAFAEKVLKLVNTTDVKLQNGDSINITCSIGCAYLPFEPSIPDFFTLEQVISISDFALYKAKENGRNCSAHINLNKKEQMKREELKNFMTTLSNDSIVNETLFKIDYIKPGV